MRRWYKIVNRADVNGELHFMNYGFHREHEIPDLDSVDEPERYPLQLYHHTVSAADLAGKDVLEVGCGRGGGVSYIERYLHPKSTTAVDLNPYAVEFCSSGGTSTKFMVMNAEELLFPDCSFDAVVNVESSHRYDNPVRFFKEVFRVLRPEGVFLFSDFRPTVEVPLLDSQLELVGFEELQKEIINDEVLAALDRDKERRADLVARYLPRIFRRAGMQFSGNPGSTIYRELEERIQTYFCLTLTKKA